MNTTATHPDDSALAAGGETLAQLRTRVPALRERWRASTPFHYIIIDDFLPPAFAEAIHNNYPKPDGEGWERTTYTHQKKKLTRRSGFPRPVAEFFELAGGSAFLGVLSDVVDIPNLLHDPELVGGGLHQSLSGGFLDVHTDYNLHPQSKLHRRLNLLLYMNKDWKPEYEGYLELWDMASHKQIENIAPSFNRVVIFETNEISFHGHPKPLAIPPHVTRSSLALYYYTTERDSVAPEHNTLYRQTTGLRGRIKTARSSLQAASERVRERGVPALLADLGRKVRRRIAGLPPENK